MFIFFLLLFFIFSFNPHMVTETDWNNRTINTWTKCERNFNDMLDDWPIN